MNKTTLHYLRLLVPRRLRNLLRRPRETCKRAGSRVQYALGSVRQVEVEPGWEVSCHPICVELFNCFRTDNLQKVEMDTFVGRCRPGMKLLDVGAHWGVFTLAALHFGGDGATVLAVEPSPEALRILNVNLQLNGCTGRVSTIEGAAGSEDGELQMLTTGAGGADYFVVPATTRPDTVGVRQVNLSSLCQRAGFVPTHMKIDVEGFEEEVLRGALPLLHQHRPELFLELHGDLIRRRDRKPEAVLSLLREASYDHWIEADRQVKQEDLAVGGFNCRMVCLPVEKGDVLVAG